MPSRCTGSSRALASYAQIRSHHRTTFRRFFDRPRNEPSAAPCVFHSSRPPCTTHPCVGFRVILLFQLPGPSHLPLSICLFQHKVSLTFFLNSADALCFFLCCVFALLMRLFYHTPKASRPQHATTGSRAAPWRSLQADRRRLNSSKRQRLPP